MGNTMGGVCDSRNMKIRIRVSDFTGLRAKFDRTAKQVLLFQSSIASPFDESLMSKGNKKK